MSRHSVRQSTSWLKALHYAVQHQMHFLRLLMQRKINFLGSLNSFLIMKTNFKTIAFIMAGAVMASCMEKEQISPVEGIENEIQNSDALVEMTFTAGVPSKAAFNAEYTKVLWEPGDLVKLYSVVSGEVFGNQFKDENLTAPSVSASLTGTASDASAFYSAVYPESAAVGCTAQGVVTASVPSAQKAVLSNFDPASSVAVAYTTTKGGILEFNNICGWVGFEIAEEYAGKVKSITLTATSSPVSGQFTATPDSEFSSFAIAPVSEQTSNAASIATASEESGLAAGKYYMSVLPGSIEGFEVTVEFMDGRIGTKSSANTLTVTRNKRILLMTVSEANLYFKTEVVEVEAETLSSPINGWQHEYKKMKPFTYLYGTGCCDGYSEHWNMFDGDFNTAWLTYKTNKSESEPRFGDPFIVIDLKKPYMIDQFGVGIDRTWGEYCRPENIEFWVTNEDPSLELTNEEARLLSDTGDLETTNYKAYIAVDTKIRAHLMSMKDRGVWTVACGSQPFVDEGHGYCEDGISTDNQHGKIYGDHYHYMTTKWNIKPEEKATYRYVCLYMKLPGTGSDKIRERNRIREFCLKRYTWYNGYKFN